MLFGRYFVPITAKGPVKPKKYAKNAANNTPHMLPETIIWNKD